MAVSDLWDTIALESQRESALWSEALRAPDERERIAIFSPLADERFAVGLETIYEGYLLHYGRPRLFAPRDADEKILVGDYLYAHGLVHIAALGDTVVVRNLAELLSLCGELRAEEARGDGPAWAATVALLDVADERLEVARRALRYAGDPKPLARVAAEVAGKERVALALALHGERVE